MKKLILTLCTLIPLLNYAVDIEHTVVPEGMELGHQFEVTDTDFPPYYFDPIIEEYPDSGYSYMWHTDEGHVSNEKKPVFFFLL